jgi:Xaa-Pro aminopeptidase
MSEADFLKRRNTLLSLMQEGVALLTSAPLKTRSNDTEHPYRQNSDFYYLTGFQEPNSVLILVKTDASTRTILYVEPHSDEHALWNGARLGVEGAAKRFDVDEVHSILEYPAHIQEILRDHTALYFDFTDDSQHVKLAQQSAKELREVRGVKRIVRSFYDVIYLVRSMRLIKSPQEIQMIRHAISLTALAHHEAMKQCKAGMREFELDAHMGYVFASNGVISQAYGAIVAGGNNANTLHYINNRDELHDGDLVLIDAACEWELYASDITRTFPINGKFSDAQRDVYEKVLDVQLRVIEAIKPNVKRDWLQKYSEELLCQALIDLGILSGERDILIAAKEHKKYAPHGIGHWMGLDVHDPCPYVNDEGESLVFESGMVMTIEPGLYIRADDESVPLQYRGIGIRIEDNILVTDSGYENLSAMIAKTVDEVEAMCQL